MYFSNILSTVAQNLSQAASSILVNFTFNILVLPRTEKLQICGNSA